MGEYMQIDPSTNGKLSLLNANNNIIMQNQEQATFT